MKNLILIVGLIILITSCKTTKNSCDAYGKLEKKDIKKDAKKMTEAEWIREYVEKVSAPSNQEGADNTKAVVAPKNDMGGKVVGGSPDNADPKGTPSNKPSGLLKSGGDLIGKTQNSPGANAGKTSFSSKAPAAKSSEESGTYDKSPLAR